MNSPVSEQEYLRDNGLLSRKFIITFMTLLFIFLGGTLFAWQKWGITYLQTITDSLVVLALGYSGISATRAATPRTAEKIRGKGNKQEGSS